MCVTVGSMFVTSRLVAAIGRGRVVHEPLESTLELHHAPASRGPRARLVSASIQACGPGAGVVWESHRWPGGPLDRAAQTGPGRGSGAGGWDRARARPGAGAEGGPSVCRFFDDDHCD